MLRFYNKASDGKMGGGKAGLEKNLYLLSGAYDSDFDIKI